MSNDFNVSRRARCLTDRAADGRMRLGPSNEFLQLCRRSALRTYLDLCAQTEQSSGDLFVEIDGTPLATNRDLTRYLLKKKPGDVVRITLYRGQKRMTVDVKLGQLPDAD